MSDALNRRELLGYTLGAAGAAGLGLQGTRAVAAEAEPKSKPDAKGPRFKLGMVTYNLAPDWDLPTLIKRCKEAGYGGVEFRTTHKHGVEPTLSKEDRAEVRKRCADGGLTIVSLGSVCQFHEADPAVVARNIEDCKRFIELAHDLGATGVKVRPNGLPKDVSEEKTLEQIGTALRTCGEAAEGSGVGIWCEVHGAGTAEPARMRRIMDIANHQNVGITWNSNPQDLKDGSVRPAFDLLRHKLYCVHINELTNQMAGAYPYRELFGLLNSTDYAGWTLMEAQGLDSKHEGDLLRFMRFYKALWQELARPA